MPQTDGISNGHSTSTNPTSGTRFENSRPHTTRHKFAAARDSPRFTRSQAPSPENFETRSNSHHGHRHSTSAPLKYIPEPSSKSEVEGNGKKLGVYYTGLFFRNVFSEWHPKSAYENLGLNNYQKR